VSRSALNHRLRRLVRVAEEHGATDLAGTRER
jgi:DNA-binding transcriptional regulator WhiA